MPKPSMEQLEKINHFTITPLKEDDCYVFSSMMIDNRPTAYYSIIHDNLLRKFSLDVKKGIGLLLSHNSDSLPIGRSFDSTLIEELNEETGEILKSLYGDFYIALGRNTESGMTTDDIVKGIDSGTIFDTSIGFAAESWECSICGEDIRSWSCIHFPGEKYIIEEEGGKDRIETCYVIVGKDGSGELLENSLVFAGACDRASIINQFSRESGNVKDGMTTLHVVKDIKNVPLSAMLYQFYAKDGCVLMTDASEYKKDGDLLKRRSESVVNTLDKYGDVLNKFGIKSTGELESKLSNALDLVEEVREKEGELSEKIDTIKELTRKLDDMAKYANELKRKNEVLEKKAEMIDEYRNDLTQEILELGVRSQGNAFKKSLFEKFLASLDLTELKEVRESFKEEVRDKFEGVRVTQPRKVNKTNGEFYRDDFGTESEYRAYISDKAVKYSKENNVSLADATKLMYKMYMKRSGE